MNAQAVLRHRPLVLPLALAAAVAMVAISESAYWHSTRTLDRLGAISEARTHIIGLQQSLLDADAARRSPRPGEPPAAASLEQARRDVATDLDFLDRYYGQDPATAVLLARLHAGAAALMALADAHGDDAGGRDALRLQLDGMRGLGAELLAHEARGVASGRADLHRALVLGRVGVAVLCSFALLALYWLLRQGAALLGQQQQRQERVEVEQQRLDAATRATQLSELAHHLQSAREDERGRLARDLHDELGALLTSAKLDAARIRSRLHGQSPEALERLAHLVETLDSVITLKRRITEDLRPSSLAHLGLATTLDILAREFAERSGVQVHCEFAAVQLGAEAELVVYRVVQEAVTNISKYAHAREVWFAMAARAGEVEITVRDDGIGFDPTAVRATAYGLVGMRFRVEAEQGTLAVISSPQRGTLIRMTLPEGRAPAIAAVREGESV